MIWMVSYCSTYILHEPNFVIQAISKSIPLHNLNMYSVNYLGCHISSEITMDGNYRLKFIILFPSLNAIMLILSIK